MESLAYLDNQVINWFIFVYLMLMMWFYVIIKFIFESCIFKRFFHSLFQGIKEILDILDSLATWGLLVRKAVLERWDFLVRQG